MKTALKVYDIELVTEAPLYIGNGREIGKKEYIYSKEKEKIFVMDISKLCQLLQKNNLLSEYEKFMLSTSKDDIGTWLEKCGVSEAEAFECVRYSLDCKDVALDNHSKLEVKEFIKDPYGMPYVPGSSLKGMLRTILLAYDIEKNPAKYESLQRSVLLNSGNNAGRNQYLSREIRGMETKCYKTLKRSEVEANAVNDTLSGLVVSDSEPLSADDLVLCQRIELATSGKEHKLNVLREAIRPGVSIHFTITVDLGICSITKEMIESAVSYFGEMYYNCFLEKYHGFAMPSEDSVWLGGGTGFATKTEIYPLLGQRQGLSTAVDIFRVLKVPPKHNHSQDRAFGVSPHICKVTYYEGKRLHMGHCRLHIKEHT